LKDPDLKLSIWAIIKDNVGKDLSKMTVPVMMNSPVSGTQQSAQLCEYVEMLERAAEEKCSAKRLGLVAGYCVAGLSIVERG
jgi:hypothetical protein